MASRVQYDGGENNSEYNCRLRQLNSPMASTKSQKYSKNSRSSGSLNTLPDFADSDRKIVKKKKEFKHEQFTSVKLTYWHDFKSHCIKNMIEVSITFGQGASLFLLLWYVRSEGATELMITPSNAFYLQYAINSCLEGFIDLTHRMRLSGMA